jgi:signal transduction histidine kinase
LDGNATMCADWQLLRIAVINLLDNASKYSSPTDEICLKVVSLEPDLLCIEVSDHGVGMPPELQAHVFEKFARGRHETDIRGSGLGLYLVNWIARFHGGNMNVTSTEGEGSTFRLCLPLCEPDSGVVSTIRSA